MKIISIRSFLYLLSIPLLLSACLDKDLPGPDGKAAFNLRLTDGPGDFQQVNINLERVQVKMENDSFQEVTTYAGYYDLLQLQNGLDTLIVNDSLPLGEIQQIRLILGDSNTVMVDSVIHLMDTPSAQQSGLKINVNRLMVQDSLNTVILDFDAEKSVVRKGNGGYSLKPVLKVVR